MITRIFTVVIRPELREGFEHGFNTTSVEALRGKPGYVSHAIGYPTKWNPDEYMMLSVWESEAALRQFAGERWDQPVIPSGMEKYVLACRVHHFTT